MLPLRSLLILVPLLVLPALGWAALSSENYSVNGYGIGAINQSVDASSTNYRLDLESGGLYTLDEPVLTPPPPSSSGGGGGGSRGGGSGGAVLGKLDSITICHSGDGVKYATRSNVNVFITLAESGQVAELRGHDGHEFDIIPAFSYVLGDGVERYPGLNWDAEGRELFENDCERFLAEPAPEPEPEPVPVPTPVPVEPCTESSTGSTVVLPLSDQTAIGVAVGPSTFTPTSNQPSSQSTPETQNVYMVASSVGAGTQASLVERFTEKVARHKAGKGGQVPPGLAKKLTEQTSSLQTTSSDEASLTPTEPAPVVVFTYTDCPEPATPPAPPSPTDSDSDPTPDSEITTPTEPPSPAPTTTPATPPEVVVEVIPVDDETLFDDVVIEDMAPVVPPFEVIFTDEAGNPVTPSEPVTVTITDPALADYPDSLYVVETSDNGQTFRILPARKVADDTIVYQTDRSGIGMVWFLPTAIAAGPGELPEQSERMVLVGQITELIALVGLGSGITVTAVRATQVPFSLAELGRLARASWSQLFGLIVFWRRKRPWGTVYDSTTKAPVDPAYVELLDLEGNTVAEAITDLDGRYGFVVPPGTYTMTAAKTNYRFPSTHKTLTGRDVLYDNLYYGGPLEVSAAVTHDIPMDPLNFDWNQWEKMRTGETRFIHRFDPWIARAMDLLFYAGAAAMVWQYLTDQSLTAGVLMFVYLVLLYLRLTRGGPVLYGTLRQAGKPLAFAVVRVLRGEHEFMSKVADAYGRYVAIVPPGTYAVRVEARIGEDAYETVFEGTVKARKGIINKNLRV